MDKRIIYTVLTILLFLGVAITLIMLRRFVPYDVEALFYDFELNEVHEDISVEELRNQEAKVLIQQSEEDINAAFYAVYIFDYETLMNLRDDLLIIETVLMQINQWRIAGLLIVENEDSVTLTFNALPENKNIYKECTVEVSKNILYLIPYTGGIVLHLDYFVQMYSILGTFDVLEESKDYYSNPVSLQVYTSGTEDNIRVFYSIRGNEYFLRNSFCAYCLVDSGYNGLEINNTTAYILS